MFWSSDILTGSQTERDRISADRSFWSSDILTGSQTQSFYREPKLVFWSSDILTGSQTFLKNSHPISRVLEQ